MTLYQYRAWADDVGGEVGEKVHQLVNELEEARKIISGKKLPQLLGSKEVAELLEIDPKNMHHTRKTKFFPAPDTEVGKRPLWKLESIQEYQELIEEWRVKKNNS